MRGHVPENAVGVLTNRVIFMEAAGISTSAVSRSRGKHLKISVRAPYCGIFALSDLIMTSFFVAAEAKQFASALSCRCITATVSPPEEAAEAPHHEILLGIFICVNFVWLARFFSVFRESYEYIVNILPA